MTWTEFAKLALETDSDEAANFALWEKSAFPFDTPRRVWKSLRSYARAHKAGRRTCDFCVRAVPKDKTICSRCERALHPVGT